MIQLNGRPGDTRHFIHKKVLGFVGGLNIPVVSTVAQIGRSLFNGGDRQLESKEVRTRRQLAEAAARRAPRLPIPTPVTTAIDRFVTRRVQPLAERLRPEVTVVPSRTGCSPGFFWDPRTGRCETVAPEPVERLPREAAAELGFGEARMGRFGAALEPEIISTSTRRCPRGAVLGQDGLCYNRRDLRNSERWWPRGRRPLLTGGDMRCISVASAAAKKLQRKQKQLEELGLLKKPVRRAAKALPPGHRAQITHG